MQNENGSSGTKNGASSSSSVHDDFGGFGGKEKGGFWEEFEALQQQERKRLNDVYFL